jgi:hypothetical protein
MSNANEVTITGILERARAAQAAKRAADEVVRAEYARQRLAKLRDEWRPIVEAVLAQIKHQLGDDSEPLVDEDDDHDGRAYYYGNGWILEQPADSTTTPRNSLSNTAYRPLKLTVEGVRVPVMCWCDGRPVVQFEPADIVLDRDEEGEEYAKRSAGRQHRDGLGHPDRQPRPPGRHCRGSRQGSRVSR